MMSSGKLVRNGIPALIEAEGRRAATAVLAGDALRQALLDKLVEEVAEVREAAAHELLEELADVLEVLRALAADAGADFDQVVAAADAKRCARGGFDGGIFLMNSPG